MKNKLKNYLIFTSVLYRIVMYVGLPIILVGIYCYYRNSFPVEAGMIAIMEAWMAVEIISDNWMFGGIQAKDAEKLDFLRTSGRGMKVIQSALIVDLLRKFLSTAVILVVCNLVLQSRVALGGWIVLYLLLVSYFFSVLGVLITRFFTLFWCNVIVSYVVLFLGILCYSLPGLPEAVLWYDIFLAVLGIGISILAVKTAMKKVRAQSVI